MKLTFTYGARCKPVYCKIIVKKPPQISLLLSNYFFLLILLLALPPTHLYPLSVLN